MGAGRRIVEKSGLAARAELMDAKVDLHKGADMPTLVGDALLAAPTLFESRIRPARRIAHSLMLPAVADLSRAFAP
jgi:hypothetical protein